jgi:ATP-binding cassette subfamily C (CFTR/MRP) protein 1
VAEFDTPANLIKQGGRFYELAKEAGLLDSDGLASALI